MSQLRVRNVAQQILFVEELSGQISDGMWENAQPFDHWQPWCECDVVVATDGNVGRTFWARKSNYLITGKELLDIVGERMLGYVRDASTRDHATTKVLPQFPDYTRSEMMRDLRDLRDIMKTSTNESTPTPYPSTKDIRNAWGEYHKLVKQFEKPLMDKVHAMAREYVKPPVVHADSITKAYVAKFDEAEVKAAIEAFVTS